MNAQPYEPVVFRVPLPKDFADEPDESVLMRANSLCATAEQIFECMIASNQQPTDIEEKDANVARDVFDGSRNVSAVKKTAQAIHLLALLKAYDMTVVESAQQLRNFCTNLLIEKAGKGKTEQVQLRAVEMLGKIKDVALFEERSTVLVEHMSAPEIQQSLREKINRVYGLASQPITDINPSPPEV